jgi:hypothetical protein
MNQRDHWGAEGRREIAVSDQPSAISGVVAGQPAAWAKRIRACTLFQKDILCRPLKRAPLFSRLNLGLTA